MLPFCFLGTRAQDEAADGEYDAMVAFSGLAARDLVRFRVERDPLPALDLTRFSGVILGGGPFNVSDPAEAKSAQQLRVEADLHALAVRVIADDVPFLGCCYGIGTLGVLQGGVVDRQYGEPVGPARVRLTADGEADPLFGSLAPEFDAFVGHKEAISRVPDGAVVLATGEACPVQAFRLGRNVYATQFHPELDAEGLVARLEVYAREGYEAPHEGDALLAIARAVDASHAQRLLAGFVELFAR